MEDTLSVKSNESLATSEEFDFVGGNNKTPTLDITNGDINQLKNALTEVLQETGRNLDVIEPAVKKYGQSTFYSVVEPGKDPLSMGDAAGSPKEKQDSVKNDSEEEEGKLNCDWSRSVVNSAWLLPWQPVNKRPFWYEIDASVSDVDQDCTIFAGVTYLGAANINAPKSEAEIQRNMAILNEQSFELGIKIAVSVPCSSQGFVV